MSGETMYYFVASLQFSVSSPPPPLLASFCSTGAGSLDVTVN